MVSGSFSAGCLEWPRAVSGCLAPAATPPHRPGDWVLHAGALSDEREAGSTLI